MLSGSSQLLNAAEHSSDNKTVLNSSLKLGRVTEHSIDGREKCICRLSFEI